MLYFLKKICYTFLIDNYLERSGQMENMDKNLQGIQYMKEGKWEEAVKVFKEIIEESPEDPYCLY